MKVQFFESMEALDHQKKSLELILQKQTKNFVWIYIIKVMTVILLLMEKKFLSRQ